MTPTKTSYSPWISQALTALTRKATAVGLPIYLLSRLYFPQKTPGTPLLTTSLVVLSSPSTLLCALGAIEGFVRSCGEMLNYRNNLQHTRAGHHWDQFCREALTTYGLMRGAFSPISGYTIIVNEWSKQGPVSQIGTPRLLKEEYLIYRSLRAFGRAINQNIRLFFGGIRWCLQKIKIGIFFVKNGVVKLVSAIWNFTKSIIAKILDDMHFIVIKTAELFINVVKYIWNFVKPAIITIWDGVYFVVSKAVDYVWRSTQPLRDIAIKAIIQCLNAIKWVLTKVIWNIVLVKVIWPPVKFIAQEMIWRSLKFGAHTVSAVVKMALALMTWTTRQTYRDES